MTTLGYLRGVREWAYPTLKTSAFLEKGVLTPEEFVAAGDELVFKCPTWSWEAGDPGKARDFLPKDKQFLVTRNVPCQTRVASMENHLATEEAGDGEDWLVSSLKKESNLEDDFDILDQDGELMQKKDDPNDAANGDDDDEYADMDAFEDNNVLQDAAAASSPVRDQQESNLLKVRTYDLSITYDKYYQTPRLWMLGKSAEGQPLSGKEMMEDVMSDYANRTVTIENHPHLTAPHASIHPCQHGKVMKTIVKNLITASTTEGEEDKGPSVEMYLFIFLKFVSSIIPTISYDFTMDVTADTSK